MYPEICHKSIKSEITKYTHESLHEIENDVESMKVVGTNINIGKDGKEATLLCTHRHRTAILPLPWANTCGNRL